jgi:hypothetical protein
VRLAALTLGRQLFADLSQESQMTKIKTGNRKPSAKAIEYALHIPDEIERQLRRCHSETCKAIRTRLLAIAAAETGKKVGRRLKILPLGPPLRFYSSESYRVSYQIDPHRRKVVVLELRKQSEQTGHVAQRAFEIGQGEREPRPPSKVRAKATVRALKRESPPPSKIRSKATVRALNRVPPPPSEIRNEATERALNRDPRTSVSRTELSRQDRQMAFRHNQHTRG